MTVLTALGPAATARTRDLAGPARVPGDYLSKILRKLVEARLLVSVKGHHGGFRLARPASGITLEEVLEAVGEWAGERNACSASPAVMRGTPARCTRPTQLTETVKAWPSGRRSPTRGHSPGCCSTRPRGSDRPRGPGVTVMGRRPRGASCCTRARSQRCAGSWRWISCQARQRRSLAPAAARALSAGGWWPGAGRSAGHGAMGEHVWQQEKAGQLHRDPPRGGERLVDDAAGAAPGRHHVLEVGEFRPVEMPQTVSAPDETGVALLQQRAPHHAGAAGAPRLDREIEIAALQGPVRGREAGASRSSPGAWWRPLGGAGRAGRRGRSPPPRPGSGAGHWPARTGATRRPVDRLLPPRRGRGRSSSARAVGRIPRPVRSRSSSPNSCRSLASDRLIADWVR